MRPPHCEYRPKGDGTPYGKAVVLRVARTDHDIALIALDARHGHGDEKVLGPDGGLTEPDKKTVRRHGAAAASGAMPPARSRSRPGDTLAGYDRGDRSRCSRRRLPEFRICCVPNDRAALRRSGTEAASASSKRRAMTTPAPIRRPSGAASILGALKSSSGQFLYCEYRADDLRGPYMRQAAWLPLPNVAREGRCFGIHRGQLRPGRPSLTGREAALNTQAMRARSSAGRARDF